MFLCLKVYINFHDIELKLNSEKIDEVNVFKFLGIWIDPHLERNEHVKIVSSKISQCMYAIKKISHLIDKPNLLKLYYAYVCSYITYGILLWGPMIKSEALHDLEKKQLNFVKSVLKTADLKEHNIVKFSDVV